MEETRLKSEWGLCPQTPGIYRLRLIPKGNEKTGGSNPPALRCSAPGTALGSVPTVALSSVQVVSG
jgi:hypothetical protein